MTEASIRSTVAADCDSLDAPRSLKDLITNYLNFTIASCLDTSALADVYELLSTCYGYASIGGLLSMQSHRRITLRRSKRKVLTRFSSSLDFLLFL